MKRLTILLFALCLCTITSAQIQTKFWGLELSKGYVSISNAKDIIDTKCAYAYIQNDRISTRSGTFGGYNWDYTDFLFFNGHTSWILYKASFNSHHTTERNAIEKFYSLLESLVAKYGAPETSSIDEGIVSIWYDEKTTNGCSLSRIKSESNGGEVLYYVSLEYYNAEYLRKVFYQEKSEL